MIRLLPDTLAARTLAVLLVGLTLSHLVSVGAYRIDLLTQIDRSGERQAAERVVGAYKSLAEVSVGEREHAAHMLSSLSTDVHWTPSSMIKEAPEPDPRLAGLRGRLVALAPELERLPLRLAHAGEDRTAEGTSQALLAALPLPDAGWLNVRVILPGSAPFAGSHGLFLSTLLMAAGVVGLSVVLIRAATAPLRAMAQAAERLGTDVTAPPLPETGPQEIRQAAHAFNEMQQRIRRLITDRTQMLAALSHDLRTPLTVMRLRAEFIEDEEQRAKMLADLDEMEAMIGATLAFLRDDADTEAAEVIDLVALLETVCDTLADTGRAVSYAGPASAPLRGRPVALKRALINLIDNAVNHGDRAQVILTPRDGHVVVDVLDDGPGIPDAELEKVFTPFYRIDGSRSRHTGGFGLGLTTARSTVRAHGGELDLTNRPEGGLRATVRLPQLEGDGFERKSLKPPETQEANAAGASPPA